MNFNSFPRCHCLESWMMVVPVINSAHITPEDRARLAKHRTGVLCCIGFLFEDSPVILLSVTAGQEHFSESFRAISRELRRLGYIYARFDSDGKVFDDLSTYGEVSSGLDDKMKQILQQQGAR